MFKYLIKKAIYLGIHEGLSENEKKQVALTNQISFILSSTTIPYFFIFYFLGFYLLANLILIFVVLYAGNLLLNNKRFYSLVRANIILTTNIGLVIFGSVN